MSLLRFRIDLAIPEPLPPGLVAALPGIKAQILKLKSYAVKINAGKPQEETTIRAVYHRCYHDEQPTKPCDPEQEI